MYLLGFMYLQIISSSKTRECDVCITAYPYFRRAKCIRNKITPIYERRYLKNERISNIDHMYTFTYKLLHTQGTWFFQQYKYSRFTCGENRVTNPRLVFAIDLTFLRVKKKRKSGIFKFALRHIQYTQ